MLTLLRRKRRGVAQFSDIIARVILCLDIKLAIPGTKRAFTLPGVVFSVDDGSLDKLNRKRFSSEIGAIGPTKGG